MQPESVLPQESQVVPQEKPSEDMKPPRKFNFLVVALIVLLLALAGMGYWAFSLNTSLKTAQAELTTLQGKYDSLMSEKGTLTTDLEATKTELEKTQNDLSTTQSDLSKSKDEVAALKAKMEKAIKYLDVANSMIVKNERDSVMVDKIKATGDSKLKSLWDAYKAIPMDFSTVDKLIKWTAVVKDFQGYLFDSITGLLKP